MVVVSFLDDYLDSECFRIFSSMVDPDAGATPEHRGLLYVRARWLPEGQLPPLIGLCEALLFIGHGAEGSNSIFSSSAAGAKEYPFAVEERYMFICQPRLVTLFVCKAGRREPGSLVTRLMECAHTNPTYFPRGLDVFSCVGDMFVVDSFHGLVGSFVFNLWAYLSQNGRYNARAQHFVEVTLYDQRVKAARGEVLMYGGLSSTVAINKFHVLLLIAYSLFWQPAEWSQRDFWCANLVAPTDTSIIVLTFQKVFNLYGQYLFREGRFSQRGLPNTEASQLLADSHEMHVPSILILSNGRPGGQVQRLPQQAGAGAMSVDDSSHSAIDSDPVLMEFSTPHRSWRPGAAVRAPWLPTMAPAARTDRSRERSRSHQLACTARAKQK